MLWIAGPGLLGSRIVLRRERALKAPGGFPPSQADLEGAMARWPGTAGAGMSALRPAQAR